MGTKTRLTGVYGGTFDPIHTGHLTPVECAAKRLNINNVIIIPCFIPPHKATPNVSAKDRLTMVQLAVSGSPLFEASDIELKRNEPSYSFYTLKELKQATPDATLCFFIGTDSLHNFTDWHRWSDILTLCHIVVCSRRSDGAMPVNTGKQLQPYLTNDPLKLCKKDSGSILLMETPEINISSTELRRRLGGEQDVTEFMSQEVIRYIQDNGLYQ